MKNLFSLFVALTVASSLWASNTITYTATEKLTGYYYYLKVGEKTFGPAITSHTFSNGIGTITCSGDITKIGLGAFECCSSLTSITIPNSVTTIEAYAFYDCSSLTSVTIPNPVTTIGSQAFKGCTSLPIIDNIRYADTYLIEAVDKSLSTYTIREGTKWIGEGAFRECSGLTSVTIPNSVTTIEDWTFGYCSGLTSVTIPNSVTTIGSYTFYDCSGLTSVTIGNSVTTIGSYAFNHCSGLTSPIYNVNCFAYMPQSYKGAYTIPFGIKQISGGAFVLCSGLTSITIPNSVTTIGNEAFSACKGLIKTNYTGTIADWCKIKFGNYLSNPICHSKNFFINDVEVKELVIPDGVDTIGEYAFNGCESLTSVTIPNSVTTIEEGAFNNCSGLTSVIIPNSVTTIGYSAFLGCSGLTAVTIPNSITTIGSFAFIYCSGLKSITCYAITPPTCGGSCFSNVDKSIPLYVPARSVNAYKQANEWKEFMNIQSFDQGQCGANLYWKYSDGVLVISGTGAMYDYTQGTAPWMPLFKDSISSLVINNGCTSIGNFAFYGLSNKNLKTIDIPNSVEQIGQYAFANCEYLKNLYLGLSLEKIAAKAFANDERLIYITCYAIEPPLLDESAFVNYDAYLSVPCESQADYKVSKGWKLFNKENISCIGAKETPITTDDVTVTPQEDQATLVWPADDQAAGYSIEISKDGVVFCTLKFNAQGQLIGIAFAPSRGGELRTMPAAEMTTSGWQFTVTGLTPGSKYVYTVDVINDQQQSIKQYTGEFTTTGGISTDWNQLTDSPVHRFTKIIKDNHLLIFHNGKTYNALGGRVK